LFDNWKPTEFIAIYAAVVSTLALATSIYVARRDRATIVVSCRPTVLSASGTPRGAEKITGLIEVEEANRGRRPVTLQYYAFRASNKMRSANMPFEIEPLPAKLEEGNSFTNYVPIRGMQEWMGQQGHWVWLTDLIFYGADGRQYRTRFWPWSRMNKLMREPLRAPAQNTDLLRQMRRTRSGAGQPGG
jgi:hypothetical protein